MAKLTHVQAQAVDDFTDPLKDLTRILYANFITWNSTLNELVSNVSANEYPFPIHFCIFLLWCADTSLNTNPKD